MKSRVDAIKEIFDAIVEMSSDGQRQSYLQEACGDDRELRVEVEALLEAHQQAGEFLESGACPDATAPFGKVAEQPGTTIGSYKLLQQIGEGGFGVVFMAQQVEPVRRKVALKVIKPGMDTKDVVARFEAERQALAMMDHPHIAHVFDGGVTESGRPYFVMELVQGIPISEYCDKHNCGIDVRLRLFSDVCRAIQHAHQKGIIHRDLKPANILVTLHGDKPVPKVIDFGVAKALHQELTEKTLFTAYGQMIGTPQYMSPEQAEMSGWDIDTRSDVYALGILLYELLTGTTPLEAEQLRRGGFAAMMQLIRTADPPPPSRRLSTLGERITTVARQRNEQPLSLERRIRGELDWIVMKALEKEPDRRYASSLDLVQDVEAYLSNEPVWACPPSRWYGLKKFASRNKVLVTTAMAVSISLLVGLAGVSFGLIRVSRLAGQLEVAMYDSENAKERAEQEAERARAAEQRVRNTAEQRRRDLHIRTINLAAATLKQHDIQRVKTLLDSCDPKQGDDDLRRWPYYYLRNRQAKYDNARRIQLPRKPLRIDVSPDGKLVAAAFPGTVPDEQTAAPIAMVLDQETGRIIDSFGEQGRNEWNFTFVAISSDSETLAYPSDDYRSVILSNLRTGTTRKLNRLKLGDTVEYAAFSPDGTSLAMGTRKGEVAVYSLEKSDLRARTSQWTSGQGSLAFSHDSSYLAFPARDNSIRIWNVRTDSEEAVLKGHAAPAITVTFSPDDKYLVSGGNDRKLFVWDIESGELRRTLLIADDAVRALAFSPLGDTMAAGLREGTTCVWSYPSFEPLDVVPGYNALYALDYLPDGTLVFGGNTQDEAEGLVFWKTRSLVERGILKCDAWVEDLAFSSNGLLLAGVTRRRSPEVHVWELGGPQPVEKPSIIPSFSAGHIAVSSRDHLAVSDTDTTSVQLFNLMTGTLVKTIQGDGSARIECLAFSPSGRRLAVGCTDGRIIVWDVDDVHLTWTHTVHDGGVSSVCFCSDENTILTGGADGCVRLWTIGNDLELRDLGNYVTRVLSVNCSTDGKTLAASFFGGEGPGVLIWDRLTYKPQRLSGHKYSVQDVAFLHAENALISAGGDRMLKVWDLESRQERLTIDASPHVFACMAMSPDDQVVAAGSRDGTILIYRAPRPASL